MLVFCSSEDNLATEEVKGLIKQPFFGTNGDQSIQSSSYSSFKSLQLSRQLLISSANGLFTLHSLDMVDNIRQGLAVKNCH